MVVSIFLGVYVCVQRRRKVQRAGGVFSEGHFFVLKGHFFYLEGHFFNSKNDILEAFLGPMGHFFLVPRAIFSSKMGIFRGTFRTILKWKKPLVLGFFLPIVDSTSINPFCIYV